MERIWDRFLTEQDKAVFAAAGYNALAGFGKRPALLVVDVSYGFAGDRPEPILDSIKRWSNSCGEQSWDAIAVIKQLTETFDGEGKMTFHLSPPLLARKDPNTGEPAKMTFGPWMMNAFGVLAKFKRLRGTALDPFGYSAERRTERALVGEYRSLVEAALASLTPASHATALAIAEVPEEIRGYGPVKDRSIEKARSRWVQLTQIASQISLPIAAE